MTRIGLRDPVDRVRYQLSVPNKYEGSKLEDTYKVGQRVVNLRDTSLCGKLALMFILISLF